MSSKRPPAPPPEIPGYRFLSVLGSGGFSDVYLYEQDRPRRRVAVKVLLSDLKTDGARRRFESEANLMAQLSTHPYIVTIYEANITAAGHSYLAMEYCSRPSLDVRSRRGRFSVDEALSVGIQVASAVETAHRAGIAHRDIKPANILVTDYNRPALTDFGISGTMDSAPDDDGGMSVPWSPPESFTAGATDGVTVDIWALGATIYTLLAGHSPFVVPGGDNSQRELMARIGSAPLPRLGRADVPEALDLVLATAMSKSPASRYRSAKALARALMRVQADLNLSVTPFEVQEDIVQEEPLADGGFEETRVRSIVAIDPDSQPSAPTFPSAFRTGPHIGQPVQDAPPHINAVPGVSTSTRGSTSGLTQNGSTLPGQLSPPQWADPVRPAAQGQPEGLLASTVRRGGGTPQELQAPAQQSGQPPELARAPGKKRWWLGLGAGAVLAAAVVVGIVVFNTAGAPKPADPEASRTASQAPAVIVGPDVPAVTNLKATAGNGGADWSWSNPDPQPGDFYVWAAVSAVSSGEFKPVATPKIFVTDNAGGQSCISVKLVRKSGSTSPETRKCFP
ncbi:serine/threonine protein kinase [Arthrobacter silviterrae]|uniref:non-specific serine/threonine protein kinase n=1 Tax=Arthrobacter silviterrae TaxID=2026658 RepID=A0ABX0D5V5_9MICC|nr:serine/threonine-protein kinase [Arthrobacter silviterrae]MDQ0279402.1 serine/threonine protein kinase [Arthrobacter silviterrae]NGN82118.1 protein kinase [Arthrobacter silviterrae]